ncbi:recombinase family protein [Rhodocytophaga rosea]|uniref:Recombinase family protein n=1 Tax=Rhodocytophaga rosea TaxID=2704465 RepID=A0A6C0GKT3_9BACT|nr:recombinase family protein [Rhodocytophaga rosea]QHT68691.1 recombinase family protein [Rhodocytophaga rosea]
MERVVLYTIVSTKNQDVERQITDLKLLAERNRYQIIEIIAETISGTKKNSERPQLNRLIELSKAKKIDKVLVTEISRLGRNTVEFLKVVEELSNLGVSVYAQNYNLETLLPDKKRNPIAQLIFTILSEFYRLERETTLDRAASGRKIAIANNVQFGRPKGKVKSYEKFLSENKRVQHLLKEGYSIRNISKVVGCSDKTVQKVKKLIFNNQVQL